MKRFYLLYLTLACAFFLAACSTENDFAAMPNLEPQFGTANEDIGLSVATVSTGRIYTLASERVEADIEGYGNETDDQIFLKRVDASGNNSWVKSLGTATWYCSERGWCDGERFEQHSLVADTKGNINTLTRWSYYDGDLVYYDTLVINRFSDSGQVIANFDLRATGFNLAGFAVDSSGNFLLAYNELQIYDYYTWEGEEFNVVVKYAPSGTRLWQRTSTVGIPFGITVTGAGNIYVVGTHGMARYSSTGNLVWTKTGSPYDVGPSSKIVASGSNIYVRNEKTVRKFDANGKLLWSKLQGGLNTLVFGDMTADANGNVYITGKYRPTTSSPANVFVRKLRPTGAILWTKTFGTPQYDDGRGIATINGSEIYVTGETQGSLAHSNYGGSDGYLRKLNSLGNTVWTR